MSIMFPRYSGFPPEIYERSLVPQMGACGFILYLTLCRISDRMSSRKFEVSDQEILRETGVSAGSVRKARAILTKLGLVQCTRVPGGAYTYLLCDVITRQPYPGDPRIKPRYIAKAERSASSSPTTLTAPKTVRPRKDREITGTESQSALPVADDTSFDFGHNVEPEEKVHFRSNEFT